MTGIPDRILDSLKSMKPKHGREDLRCEINEFKNWRKNGMVESDKKIEKTDT